jgi:Alr-MurF fusion protein
VICGKIFLQKKHNFKKWLKTSIMPEYRLKKINELIGGKYTGNDDPVIRNLVTDSRNLISPSDSVFFAIRGERHDGHQFIEELYKKRNLRSFVVDHIDLIWEKLNANFIIVDNVLESLQRLCTKHRLGFPGNVIGITGSNGKTIIKEWLYQLMHQDKTIIRNPKSYNSQVGVPLSVWNLEQSAELAVFEAGISKPGEMEHLEVIIKPDIGIFTNIGEAHQENFSTFEEKARQKLMLFKNAKTLIYCKDQNIVANEIEKVFSSEKKLINWSMNQTADLQILQIIKNEGSTILYGTYNSKSVGITIPFVDNASVENSIHCWLLMLYLGYNNNIIADRMKELTPVAMRLELKKGINNCTIINDSYNSDIHSLNIAIDFLNQQHQHKNKTLILSDILQTGKNEAELYREVSKMLKDKNITRIVGIGPALFRNASIFRIEKDFFLTTDDFIKQDAVHFFKDEAILLKGARNFEFERISAILEHKAHNTVLEINLSAMIHNLNYFRTKLKSSTKIIAMVKAFSYGSGSFEIANMLEFQKIDYLGVAFADEGVALRQAGISIPIIVMNPEESAFRLMVEYRLEPEIYSFGVLKLFTGFLKSSQIENFPVHIKIDTRMHRLGFVIPEIPLLCEELMNNKHISVQSVFSHLAASDEKEHDKFTKEQIRLFERISSLITEAVGKSVEKHILNSSGIERFPEGQFSMVRLGIGLYGINPFNQGSLRNVSSLKTFILQTKTVMAGETIGYSRKGKTDKEIQIAILPIGYADGYCRKLGNGIGKVWINGHIAPVVGNICMDMFMVDITGIDAKEGDEVEVFGDHITITQLAAQIETIPYEILTGISARVKRVYVQE